MNIGERLTSLRENKGYMQKDVAYKLEIAANTLSGYERNLRKPDTDALIKLAKFYNVSSDYLLGISDKPHRNEYLLLAKKAEENNIDIDDLEMALETIVQLKNKSERK